MIFAQLFDSPWLLPALGFLAVILMMRRAMVRGRGRRGGDDIGEVHRELRETEQTSAGRLQQLESRLHDYGREVEGRIQTNLAALDELIAEADREIARLETLLDETRRRQSGGPAPPILPFPLAGGRETLNAEQRQMIRLLAQAGYTAAEIAQLVDRSPDEVRAVLNDPGRAEAA